MASWRRVSVAVLLLVAAVAGAVALPLSAASAATTGAATTGAAGSAACPKVLFIGIRGSGQAASEDSGYGDAVEAVRDGFVASVPKSVSYESVALQYPAAPVPLSSASNAAWQALLQSIADGTRALDQLLTASERTCTGASAQKWVVAGYSQGALIINQAIRNFPAAHFARVDLIGDPDRVPDQVGTQTGSALPGYGIGALIKLARVTGPLPASFARVTTSLCDSEDLICDYSHVHTSAEATYGGTVHATYAVRDHQILQSMGAQAGQDAGGGGAQDAPVLTGATALGSVTVGSRVESTITGLAPGEAVQVVLESPPSVVGTVRASDRGVARYALTVPQTLPRGAHRLVFVTGTGAVSRTFWVGPVATPRPTATPGSQTVIQAPAALRLPKPPDDHSALLAAVATAVAVAVAAAGTYLNRRHRDGT